MNLRALGRYEIRGEIGRGSMGIVYRAYDPVIDRPVAIKTIFLPERLPPSDARAYLERFFLEARIAGKLLHPNIVVTYDAATDEKTGVPFIAMELVQGEALSERLRREQRLPWREAVDIVIPLAEALDYAHERGVVHRDIKPANVLLGEKGQPKITDFGIAKIPATELTQTGVVVGTPYFMSPEQLQGEPLDGRSDLFSLGGVLYRLMLGKPPFQGADLTAVTHQILYKAPNPPSELLAEIPSSLDGVVARCLTKAPADRYPSGRSLAADLLAVRGGEPPKMAVVPAEKTERLDATPRATEPEATEDSPAAGTASPRAMRRHGRGRVWMILGVLVMALVITAWRVGFEEAEREARRGGGWLLASLEHQLETLKGAVERRQAEKRKTAAARSEASTRLRQGEQLERRGHWRGAREAYEAALVGFREVDDGVGEASVLLARGRLEARRGEWSKARADVEAAAAVYRIYRSAAGRAEALLALGDLRRDRGDFAGADAVYDQALRIAETSSEDRLRCEARLHRALGDLLQGKWEAARQGLDDARSHMSRIRLTERDELGVMALTQRGVVSYVTGDAEGAFSWWERARRACASTDCPAEVSVLEGRAALDMGDRSSARARLEEAAAGFRRLDHLPGLAAALESLAEMAGQGGEAAADKALAEELSRTRSRLGLPAVDRALGTGPPAAGPEGRRFQRLLCLTQALPRDASTQRRTLTLRSMLLGRGQSPGSEPR